MTKTICGEHRRVGYAYRWNSETRTSSLTCRACGLSELAHETISETVRRLASEGGN